MLPVTVPSMRCYRLPIVLPFVVTTKGEMAKSSLGRGRGTGIPTPVDVHVGARMRQRRTLSGMTQTTLADALGLSFQQVQRYENATNRIGASRLFDLSRVLDVPVEYFFDDMPSRVAASSPAPKRRGRAKGPPSYEAIPMAKRETLDLVRAYYKIRDPQIRKRLYKLAKAVGAAANSSD